MDTEQIDCELIKKVLEWIVNGEHDHPKEGTILIFLPGIAVISNIIHLLRQDTTFRNEKQYKIYPLHSSVTSEEQSLIFK